MHLQTYKQLKAYQLLASAALVDSQLSQAQAATEPARRTVREVLEYNR